MSLYFDIFMAVGIVALFIFITPLVDKMVNSAGTYGTEECVPEFENNRELDDY